MARIFCHGGITLSTLLNFDRGTVRADYGLGLGAEGE
jgi:hypothetical protein